MDTESDIKKEHDVMRLELDSLLKSEVPKACKFLNEYLEHILCYFTRPGGNDPCANTRLERANLTGNQAQEGNQFLPPLQFLLFIIQLIQWKRANSYIGIGCLW